MTLYLLTVTATISAQTITKQFQETKYNFKDFCMADATTGYGVGGTHWDQSIKKFKSTIIKTSNAGEDWIVQNCDIDDNLWSVHFINANKGWAVGDSGSIVFTENGGDNWGQQEVNTSLNFKSVHFSDELNGWAVANEPIHFDPFNNNPNAWQGKVWHTSDGGAIWTEQTLPSDIGIIHCVYFQNNLSGWAVGVKNHSIDVFVDTYCAAYFTEDGGHTWVEKFSPELKLVFTDISFVDDKHGWLVGFASSSAEDGGTIFRTVDGGENWQRITENHLLWQVEFVDSLKGYAVGTDYIAAWGPPVMRTLDGGQTWEKVHMEKNDLQGLYGLSVNNDRVVAIGDKGYVATSTDPWGEYGWPHGENLFTQKQINSLYEFEDVFFINELKGWVVGQKNAQSGKYGHVILHSEDGGLTWQEQYSFAAEYNSPGFRLNAIQFVNETTGWAVGTGDWAADPEISGILFTDDGGATWTQQAQGVAVGQIVDLFFFDDQKGWALTDANSYPDGSVQLLKTVNGGTSWELINTGQTGLITIGYAIRAGKICFQDSTTGWVLGIRNTLLKTVNGGDNWSSVTLPNEYTNTHSMAFCDQQTGYISGELNFLTQDGGASWSEDHLIDRTFTDLCFTDPLQGWMVGEWCNIYQTKDKGSTWERVEHSATTAAMKSVTFINEKSGWATGRAGTIIKIDNSNPAEIKVASVKNAPQSYELYQNHPNPFNPSTTIKYYIPETMSVKLSVYDLLGREIEVLVNEIKTAGTQQVKFNATQLGSGLYIYRLQTGNYSAVKKMMFLK